MMLVSRLLVPALVLAISLPAAAQTEVPAVLRSLKPHQIVEAVAAERPTLGLTTPQAQRLDSLHLAIRSEPHAYVSSPSTGKAHRNTRMKPMISGQQAFEDAMAILTPEQRLQARARFGDAEYKLPADLQREQDTSTLAGEPLHGHTPGAAPRTPSTKPAGSAREPLQHHGGEVPTAAASDSGTPTDPVTHRP
jgi:hypothetical protein